MPGPARFKDLCIDANDHQHLADWWCQCLGYVRLQTDDEVPMDAERPVPIVDPDGAGPLIWVNPVPEPKTVKNRMHLDVVGDVDTLLGLGARIVRAKETGRPWDVLADPEDNEFCVFAPQ